MHKIAIVQTKTYDFNYGDDFIIVPESITDWIEVTDDEFTALVSFSRRAAESYHVIEQPIDQEKFVKKTVADYIQYTQVLDKQELERKELAAKKKVALELKKRARTEEAERELLVELEKKYKK